MYPYTTLQHKNSKRIESCFIERGKEERERESEKREQPAEVDCPLVVVVAAGVGGREHTCPKKMR